jgi:prepilin-type N-terminal cleavage/methylation domain-containing protein
LQKLQQTLQCKGNGQASFVGKLLVRNLLCGSVDIQGVSDMKHTTSRIQQGFSLTEALVVLVMFGFVMTITVPMLNKQLQEYRLMRSTREVLANLQLARLKSVSNNFNYSFTFTRSDSSYQVSGAETVGPDGVFHSWNDANANGVQDTDDAYKTTHKLVYGSFGTAGITTLPNTSAVGTPPATIKITFKPDGTVDQTATSTTYRCIILQNVGHANTQAVCVDNDGFTRLYKRYFNAWKEIK